MRKYYIVDYDTGRIIDELYQRPSVEYLDKKAKENNPAGCSLYVIGGEKLVTLTYNYYPQEEQDVP